MPSNSFGTACLALMVLVGTMLSRDALAADPANRLLVFISSFATGDDAGIHACSLDLSTGKLEPIRRSTDVQQTFFMALSPDRRHLFATHAPNSFGGPDNEEVSALEVVDEDGQLKLLNRQSSLGTATCYLHVDATGKSLLVANYSSGSVAVLPIRADGTLGEAASFVKHEGSSVNPERQGEPHAHAIIPNPSNRFAYAADLGTDKIMAYRLDADTGRIAAAFQPFARTPAGSGPRHLTFHPRSRRLYAINELLNTVTLFDHDADSGFLIERQTISTLPDGYQGTSYTADLKITPDGRFLYGTNRGHHSVAAYRIADEGTLELVEIEPSGGAGPQNLAITPDGQYLLVANMPGNNVAVFRIDAKTGALERVGEPVAIPMPSCILIR